MDLTVCQEEENTTQPLPHMWVITEAFLFFIFPGFYFFEENFKLSNLESQSGSIF